MRVLLIALALFLFVGCSKQIPIDTEPQGAVVTLDGKVVGNTPTFLNVTVSSTARHSLKIEKDGYLGQTHSLAPDYDPITNQVTWPKKFFYRLVPDK